MAGGSNIYGFRIENFLEIKARTTPPPQPIGGCLYINHAAYWPGYENQGDNWRLYRLFKYNTDGYGNYIWSELIDEDSPQTLSNKIIDESCSVRAPLEVSNLSVDSLIVVNNIIVGGTVDGVDISQLSSAFITHSNRTDIHHIHNNKPFLDVINQNLSITSSPTFTGLTINGNIIITGTVDGVDVSAHAANTTIHHTHTNKGYLDSLNQNLSTTSNPTFNSGTFYNVNLTNLNGQPIGLYFHTHSNKTILDLINQNLSITSSPTFANIITSGLVDGVDVSSLNNDYQITKSDFYSLSSDYQVTKTDYYNTKADLLAHETDDSIHLTTETYTCHYSVQVGDFVYLDSLGIAQRGSGASLTSAKVVGYVFYKPTLTSCEVKDNGKIIGLSGLIPNQNIILGLIPGLIVQSASGFLSGNAIKIVGKAISSSAYKLNIYVPPTLLAQNR